MEEDHAMDKPKPLEEVSDGDLTEIKKDPVWKTWLEKDAIGTKQVTREKLPKKEYCPTCGQVDPIASSQQKELGQSHGEQSTAARDTMVKHPRNRGLDYDKDGRPWLKETDPDWHSWKRQLYNDIGDPRDYSKEYYPGQMSDSDDKGAMKKKAWEVWLDNVTKPIPDSKGGKGSFQHCINANQDKHNPGGWCKQIERKIEGKSKGLGILGEGKLNRKTGKPMKLKPRKITLDDYEHDKPGDKKPTYFQAIMEEERKKMERKKAGEDATEDVVSMVKRRKRLQDYFEGNEKKKVDKIEEPESDYYMDAGGNPQLKEKADYFIEEIRSNIIYHNKILPILGMIAGQVARGVGQAAKKIGPKLLADVGAVGQGMMEEEEEEQ